MDKKRIYIINGANLNRLGRRDVRLYGTATLPDIEHELSAHYGAEVELVFRQYDGEGEIIGALQSAGDDASAAGVVINPGAYAHYSLAIADAISDLRQEGTKVIEVHISNIFSREEYRRRSVTGACCEGVITGLGTRGYRLAIEALLDHDA